MSNIVRAWKDEAYRHSLSKADLALLPASPVGELELTDIELEAISGACGAKNDPKNNSNNKVQQDADQKAFATFGSDALVVNSYVVCYANNSADLDADIRRQHYGYYY